MQRQEGRARARGKRTRSELRFGRAGLGLLAGAGEAASQLEEARDAVGKLWLVGAGQSGRRWSVVWRARGRRGAAPTSSRPRNHKLDSSYQRTCSRQLHLDLTRPAPPRPAPAAPRLAPALAVTLVASSTRPGLLPSSSMADIAETDQCTLPLSCVHPPRPRPARPTRASRSSPLSPPGVCSPPGALALARPHPS